MEQKKTEKVLKRTKTKNKLRRTNAPVMKSVESVLRSEESLWWKTFMKEVGFEPGVKERGSY